MISLKKTLKTLDGEMESVLEMLCMTKSGV
jgi:hypothetical protein